MNDTDLQHLLKSADRPATASAAPAELADRVRRQVRRSQQRRLAAVPVVVAVLAIGVWFARPAVQPMVLQGGPGSTPAIVPAKPPTLSIDDEIRLAELRIHRLQQVERLAHLAARRAAVRDPIAVMDEQLASDLLERANRANESTAPANRQQILALVVRQYPQTLTADIARREMQTLQ